MNYLGYNKDNFKEGDAGIDNGTLQINDYILPSVAGASGDVLTMDANGQNTSFQPAGGGATTIERPIQNLFTMLTPRTSYTTGNPDPYQVSSSGSNIIDTADFDVGDVIRVRAEGYYVNTAPDPVAVPCTIQHQWFISYPNLSVSDETLSTPVQFNGSGGNWFNEIIFTWESASSVRITFNGKINYNTGFAVSDDVRALNWFVGGAAPPGTERPKTEGAPYYIYPPPPIFEIRGQNLTVSGSGYSIATNYYIDKMNTDALVSGGGVPTIDHLTLSNLNVASSSGDVDAGHSTLVCLDGRAGGQQIIGGRGSGTLILKSNDTTPLINNIELGSGLDTKIHKIFSNSVATPLVIEHESAIDKIDLRINNNNKVEIKDTEVQLNENLNMNSNEIKNVSVIDNSSGNLQIIGQSTTSAVELDPNPTDGVNITTASKNINVISNNDLLLKSNTSFLDIDSNLIRFISTGTPQGQIDAVGGYEFFNSLSMTNNNINNVNVLQATQVNTDTIENSGSGFLSFTNLGGAVIPSFTSSGLDMNLGEIANVANIKNSGVLNINQGGLTATNIYGNGGFKMQISNAVYIINGVILNIHDKIIYVPPNQMPTSFIADYTYIFVNSRTTANSYTLPANCKIMGTGKNNSTINYTGAGSLFTTTDNNLSITDITLTSSNNAGILLTASNVAKNKTINFTGLQIRNSKNGMDITGYDLIDFNNCIFTYFESGSLSPIGVKITDASKVQLSSTEFLRWFQEGGTPATTFFNGNMLEFVNVLNALNINGCFFHPQYDQNGIDLSAVSSVIEGTITSNTFIDINLNTPTFNVLNIPTAIATNYVVEGNSIYPNLRANLTYVFSGVNATNTILSGGSNPNVINTGGLAIALTSQFSSISAGGLATYLKKRSANFLITASANLQVIAGGAGQRVGLGLRVNGVDIPNGYSFVTLDSAGTEPKQTTLNFTGVANQNDTFELTIFNASGNNDVLVSDVNFAGIEI